MKYHHIILGGCILMVIPAFTQERSTINVADTGTVGSQLSMKKNEEIKITHLRKNTGNFLTSASFKIPASFILYGYGSFELEALEDINSVVKNEIWTKRVHKKNKMDDYLQFAPAAFVYALNAAGIKGKHNFRDRTMIYALSTAIMATTVFATKKITAEWRPDSSNLFSFPSGHTASSFAAAEFLRLEYKDKSIWYGIAGYGMATFTGFLRLYNNKHWLGDVIAGAGAGILSTRLAYLVYPYIKNKLFKNKPANTYVTPFFRNKVAGILLIHYFPAK